MTGQMLDTQQRLKHALCTESIKAPIVPFSTQRGEERRVESMLCRTDMAVQAALHQTHPTPFVVAKWQHPVVPQKGIRKAMYESAQLHTRPTGTGLSETALRKLYSRQVSAMQLRPCGCKAARPAGSC